MITDDIKQSRIVLDEIAFKFVSLTNIYMYDGEIWIDPEIKKPDSLFRSFIVTYEGVGLKRIKGTFIIDNGVGSRVMTKYGDIYTNIVAWKANC